MLWSIVQRPQFANKKSQLWENYTIKLFALKVVLISQIKE